MHFIVWSLLWYVLCMHTFSIMYTHARACTYVCTFCACTHTHTHTRARAHNSSNYVHNDTVQLLPPEHCDSSFSPHFHPPSQLAAASEEKLLARLTNLKGDLTNYLKVFFVTYPVFTTSKAVLRALAAAVSHSHSHEEEVRKGLVCACVRVCMRVCVPTTSCVVSHMPDSPNTIIIILISVSTCKDSGSQRQYSSVH